MTAFSVTTTATSHQTFIGFPFGGGIVSKKPTLLRIVSWHTSWRGSWASAVVSSWVLSQPLASSGGWSNWNNPALVGVDHPNPEQRTPDSVLSVDHDWVVRFQPCFLSAVWAWVNYWNFLGSPITPLYIGDNYTTTQWGCCEDRIKQCM